MNIFFDMKSGMLNVDVNHLEGMKKNVRIIDYL